MTNKRKNSKKDLTYAKVQSVVKEGYNNVGYSLDGPACTTCGTIMQQTGKCFTCPGCGESGGCG